MSNEIINTNVIKKYLLINSFNRIDTKIFLKLYSNYCMMKGKLSEENILEDMKKLEDDVYSFEGTVLPDNVRIDIEMQKIKNALKTFNNKTIKNHVQKHFDELELNYLSDEPFAGYNDFIKADIARMQALLGLDITFYKEAYVMFLAMYENIRSEYGNSDDYTKGR